MDASAPLFRARTLVLLAVVGLVGFILFLLAVAFGGDAQDRPDAEANATSNAAIGYTALVALESRIYPQQVHVGGGREAWQKKGLLIATPPVGSEDELAKLVKIRNGCDQCFTLYILPKWDVDQERRPKRGWVYVYGTLSLSSIQRLAHAINDDADISTDAKATLVSPQDEGVSVPAPKELRVLEGWDGGLLLSDTGQPVLVEVSERTFVLADPDLMANHALKTADGARLAAAVIDRLRQEAGGGPILFDTALLNSGDNRSLLRLMFTPPFLGLTLCLAFAFILLLMACQVRFGPIRRPQRAIAFGKRALVANSALMIKRAGRELPMAHRYLILQREGGGTARPTTARPVRAEVAAAEAALEQARSVPEMIAAAATLHSLRKVKT